MEHGGAGGFEGRLNSCESSYRSSSYRESSDGEIRDGKFNTRSDNAMKPIADPRVQLNLLFF